MSASSAPTTVMLWLSCPTDEAMAPRCQPEPLHERDPDAALARLRPPVALDDGHLDDVLIEVDPALALRYRAG